MREIVSIAEHRPLTPDSLAIDWVTTYQGRSRIKAMFALVRAWCHGYMFRMEWGQ